MRLFICLNLIIIAIFLFSLLAAFSFFSLSLNESLLTTLPGLVGDLVEDGFLVTALFTFSPSTVSLAMT